MESLNKRLRRGLKPVDDTMSHVETVMRGVDKTLARVLKEPKSRANFPLEVQREEWRLSGGCCRMCGKVLKEHQFEYHHRNLHKENKSQNNCRVVCCDCHGEITAGDIIIP